MSLTEKLKELKALLFAEDAPPADTPKPEGKTFGEYRAAKIEVGEVVEVKNDAGEFIPAPAGTIDGPEGEKITIGEGGKITEIKPKEETPAPVEAAAEGDPAKGGSVSTPQALEAVSKAEFEELRANVTALNSKIDALLNKGDSQFSTMKSLFEAVETLANASQAEPTDAPKSNAFSAAKSDKQTAKEKLKQAFDAANKK